jgi:hypothetical protein
MTDNYRTDLSVHWLFVIRIGSAATIPAAMRADERMLPY